MDHISMSHRGKYLDLLRMFSGDFDLDPLEHDQIMAMCPYCHGGLNQKRSLAVNLERGLFRCLREINCGKTGNSVRMYSDMHRVSTGEAWRVLTGLDEFSPLSLLTEIDSALQRLKSNKGFSLGTSFSYDYNALTIDPYEDDDVLYWIRNVRGYDPDWFFSCNKIFLPSPAGIHAGRLGFYIETEGNQTYLLYSMLPDLQPKTINAPGDKHSLCLYNYDNITGDDPVFICEGIFDCLRMLERGFSAVATFGVNLSEYQAVLLDLLPCNDLIFAWDAGTQQKVDQALPILREFSASRKNIYQLIFEEDGEDPDSVSKKRLVEYMEKIKEI